MKKNPNRIILTLDSHALTYSEQCLKKYYFNQVENLHLLKIEWPKLEKGKFTSVKKQGAKELGTFIHDIIMRVNRLRLRVIKGKVPFKFLVTDSTIINLGFKHISRRKEFSQDDKIFHQTKFMEFYSMIKTTHGWLTPLGYETGFSKILYEDNDVCFIYEGRVDFIGESANWDTPIWVDYKTQSRESPLYENTNQFLGYSWAVGTNLGFIQYYGLQKDRRKEEAFRLKTIFHPQHLIEQWKKETIHQFRKVAGLIPFGEKGFDRNRSHCVGDLYGPCMYVKICDNASALPEVLNGIKQTFYKIEKWSPWGQTETNGS